MIYNLRRTSKLDFSNTMPQNSLVGFGFSKSGTEWTMFKKLINEKRLQSHTNNCDPDWNWLAQLLRESAKGASNRAGRVFTLDEFRRLLTKGWDKDGDMCLADWMTERFCAITLLLGALPGSVLTSLATLPRSGQFDRFREGGLASIEKLSNNRDEEDRLRPIAQSTYNRLKNRNGANPTRADEEFDLVIVCLCDQGHLPIDIVWDRTGNAKVIRSQALLIQGNVYCWYGLFEWLTNHLEQNRNAKLIQKWNIKRKQFGTQTISGGKMKGCINRWCKICGVVQCSLRFEEQLEHWLRTERLKQHLGPKEFHLPYYIVFGGSRGRWTISFPQSWCPVDSSEGDGRLRPQKRDPDA